jgi:hypothetical protein
LQISHKRSKDLWKWHKPSEGSGGGGFMNVSVCEKIRVHDTQLEVYHHTFWSKEFIIWRFEANCSTFLLNAFIIRRWKIDYSLLTIQRFIIRWWTIECSTLLLKGFINRRKRKMFYCYYSAAVDCWINGWGNCSIFSRNGSPW